jgi:hypothetical protein
MLPNVQGDVINTHRVHVGPQKQLIPPLNFVVVLRQTSIKIIDNYFGCVEGFICYKSFREATIKFADEVSQCI